MKALRYITTILLLAAGAGHIFLFIKEPAAASSSAVLAFGIIYFVIGILLFLKIKYSAILGIVFPLIGTIAGLIAFDPTEMTLLLKILGITDVMTVILCSVLEWDIRRKAG